MLQEQLAIFVENRTGKLHEITKIIASCSVNLRALCIAETTNYGILRIIVDKPSEVLIKLKAAGLTVQKNNMLVIKMDDCPGSLAAIAEVLAQHNIAVEYLYAFLASEQIPAAYVALRVSASQEQEAVAALLEKGYTGYEI